MRRFHRRFLATAVIAAVSAGFGASAGAGADRGNTDGALVIGSLAPETGELSAIIDSLRVPVRIAVDEINAAGGVNDAPVTLVTGDDGTDAEVASQTLDRLLTVDKADVIIGPADDGTALGILDKIGSGARAHLLGIEHDGRAVYQADSQDGEGLLPAHRAARSPPRRRTRGPRAVGRA